MRDHTRMWLAIFLHIIKFIIVITAIVSMNYVLEKNYTPKRITRMKNTKKEVFSFFFFLSLSSLNN